MNRQMWPRMVQVAAVLTLLIAGSFAYYRYAPRQMPIGQPPLTQLSADTLRELRTAFNAASDRTRLLLLLSPT